MEDFRKLLQPDDRRPDLNAAIKAGSYVVSIQASANHYCAPVEDLKNKHGYRSWEVAILNRDGKSIRPHRSSKLRDYWFVKLWYRGRWAGWVPTKKVQEILNDLEKLG